MNKSKVLVFGTFDHLHPGHLDFFRQAREHGDRLVAVIGLDSTVRSVKGKAPRQNEQTRLQSVKNCELVDEARLGYEGDPYRIIKDVDPDIICLGYDQNSFSENLEAELKKISVAAPVIRLKPFHSEKYKSSLM